MIDVHSYHKLTEAAGGRYALAALLQKRVIGLMRGAPPLVDSPTRSDAFRTALAEIGQEKIALSAPEKPKDRSGK